MNKNMNINNNIKTNINIKNKKLLSKFIFILILKCSGFRVLLAMAKAKVFGLTASFRLGRTLFSYTEASANMAAEMKKLGEGDSR